MLTIVLPLPDPLLSPNARPHRMALARKKAKARFDGKIAAQVAMGDAGIMSPPMLTAARVQCHFFFRERRNRDADNYAASLKAAMDGISDAGVWVNDSVVSPDAPIFGYDKRNPRVEIVVTRKAELPPHSSP